MRLHLCCGPVLLKDWTNVDMFDFGQEVVADLNARWTFAADDSIDEIRCDDGFEHVDSSEHFLAEAARVLRPGGTLTIWVPHYKNPAAYRMTHRRFLSWNMFAVFPEPHDGTQSLRVVSNRLFIGRKESAAWRPIHALINTVPKWWERLFYASNVEVAFAKR